MLPRFFVPQAETTGSVVQLPDDEAAHLVHVLRLRAGDAIRVFDGRGREWHARVDDISKTHARVRLDASVTPSAEPHVKLTLAIAILKGDKMDDVIRDAVMLGVSRIAPIITERVEISPKVVERTSRIDRWRRIAVASAKQCGRSVVPEVRAPVEVAALFAEPSAARRVVLVEPGADVETVRKVQDLARADDAELFIGPEGGWTAPELEAAVGNGAVLATLGALTLRADAVPLVAITALRTVWDDL